MTDYSTLSSREIERLSRNIGPGEWAVETERPIATLLGSCVAVCLFDPTVPIGGMNHFMLPRMQRSTFGDEDILLAGDACMEALLNAMLVRGAARKRIRAKAFGGGTLIESGDQRPSIGKRNTDFARDWLEREEIPLLASDFLGPWSRKVLFVPGNGDAWCKRMNSGMITAETIRREEEAYAAAQASLPVGAAKRVELF